MYGDDVIVLGLSGNGLFGQEGESTLTAFRDQTGVTFPILTGDETYRGYANTDGRISPYPLDVILDRQGVIRYQRHEFDAPAMIATIEQLLLESP